MSERTLLRYTKPFRDEEDDSEDDAQVMDDDLTDVPAEAVETNDRDVVALDAEPTNDAPIMCIGIGDTQHGERGFMLDCWDEVIQSLAKIAKKERPKLIKYAFPGDNITGASVFRGQAYQVNLPNTSPQIAYSAQKYHEAMQAIDTYAERSIAIAVDGNHDKNHSDLDLTARWSDVLSQLGHDCVYAGQRATINLAPERHKRYLLGCEHGFGGSSYYPNSYSLIRALQSYMAQSSVLDRFNGDPIRRFLVGHTHWLNVGYDVLSSSVKLDTVGGWTRPERYKLGGASRPIGAVVYLHYGHELVVRTVAPRGNTLRREMDDHNLAWRNLADVAESMIKFSDEAVLSGLVASPGTVL